MPWKKLLNTLLFVALSISAHARENIWITSPYSAGSTGNIALQRVVDRANVIQNQYQLLLDIRAGGQGLVAIRSLAENPQQRLALINASYIEHLENNTIKEADYVPVHAVGEACWAVASLNGNERQGISSLRNTGEIVVGTIGQGNVTHLTALAIAEKTRNSVVLIPFKSNKDALINMAGNNGVNFVIERWEHIENLKSINSKMRVLGVSCGTRLQALPNMKTLQEQGIDAPGVFMILVSSSQMSLGRQQELGALLDQSTKDIGLATMMNISDMHSPVFGKETAQQFYRSRIQKIQQLRQKFQIKLDNK
jgi:tripartite-type tricarboxylate transporter receptor subunit TctC